MYCLSGSVTMQLEGRFFTAGEGSAVFVGSAEAHAIAGASPGAKILLLEIGPVFLKNNFNKLAELVFREPVMSLSGRVRKQSAALAEMGGLFERIRREVESPLTVESAWMVTGCLHLISAHMLRSLPCDRNLSEKRRERLRALGRVNEALEYISLNFNKSISLAEISHYTGYQRSNFCRHFKNATQMTFHQYLNVFRVNKACEMLVDHSVPVSLVAENSGFSEIKTFYRVFKSVIHMTPSEYRRDQTEGTAEAFL